jgi:hypothetical protein
LRWEKYVLEKGVICFKMLSPIEMKMMFLQMLPLIEMRVPNVPKMLPLIEFGFKCLKMLSLIKMGVISLNMLPLNDIGVMYLKMRHLIEIGVSKDAF